jgi:hypothetical protein
MAVWVVKKELIPGQPQRAQEAQELPGILFIRAVMDTRVRTVPQQMAAAVVRGLMLRGMERLHQARPGQQEPPVETVALVVLFTPMVRLLRVETEEAEAAAGIPMLPVQHELAGQGLLERLFSHGKLM